MDIRKLDRGNLTAEYGVLTQRLLPWPVINAPFEGAWAVIEPGSATTPHSHHEYEMFIATAGEAVLQVGEERSPFVAGDVAYMTPGQTHQVINESDADFQMYSVWWDPEMTERFTAAHG